MAKLTIEVIEHSDLEKFTSEVNKYLEEGWELHGNLIALLDTNAYNTNNAVIYIQAVKKEAEVRFGMDA